MPYKEIIAVCSQIHTKHINTVCGQNVEFVDVKAGGTYRNHWVFLRIDEQMFGGHLWVCLVMSLNILPYVLIQYVGWVAQSVWRLTTVWTVRDRIPMGTRFSARPDRPWGPPNLLYSGYRVFPLGKVWPGRAADHSPPSSAAVMEE